MNTPATPSGMTFGQAIHSMKKDGKKVRRAGWNGKGMWIAYTPGYSIEAISAHPGAALHLAKEIIGKTPVSQTALLEILPHFDMRSADDKLVVGWLPSQTDMDANDWEIVP